MGVLIKSRDQIQREILDRLRDAGLLTNLSPGRAAFILAQIHADHLSELYSSMEANTSMAFVASAAGPFLDLIAELFGVFRLPQQAGLALSDERNVRFFVNTGTLAAVIPTKFIPLGTTITSSDGAVTYQVLEDTPFNDVATEVFVSVVSDDIGPTQNVGRGDLSSHSLGSATVLVTNTEAISTAADVEDDDQLRSRIADANLTRATANMTSIREAINIVPGVAFVRLEPFRNGPGTVQATVIPTGNTFSNRLLTQIRSSIDQVRGAGTIVDVRGPRFVDVEIVILLRFREDTPEGAKDGIRRRSADALVNYLEEIRVGGLFVIQEMIQRVLDISEQILEFETRCFAFRGRAQVLRNFQPDPDELLRPDPAVAQPIRAL